MYKGLHDFYRSQEWVMFRLNLINERLNEQGEIICEHCGKPIVNKYDCIGHHITELTDRNVRDAEIALNPNNVMLVHHVCHNEIHNKLGTFERQVWLVYGAPLSGKSTYVNNVMLHGDLIVDVDRIWQCVSGCDMYVKPDRLKDVVFAVRDELIMDVKYRRGSWKNAYIIGGYPLIGERERLCKMLGAREIFVECPIEESLARLAKNPDGRNVGEWVKYIHDWWDKYGKGRPRAL